MSDIVKRLKKMPPREVCEHGSQKVKCPICELEEAYTELERLKKVLHEIAKYPKLYGIHDIDDAYSLAHMAERALEKKDAS